MRDMSNLRSLRRVDSAPLARGTRADGYGGRWQNPNSGQGSVLDRHAHTFWALPVRLDHSTIDSLLEFSAMARRIVFRESEDATRKGYQLGGLDGGGYDLQAIEEESQRLNLLGTIAEARAWARGYGGGAVLIAADDGRKPSEPLDYVNLRRVVKLEAVDRWDLTPYRLDNAERFGQPLTYALQVEGGIVEVHHTRVVRFDGVSLPRRKRRENHGWGGSEIDLAWAEIRNWSTSNEYAAEAITMMSQGVFKTKHLGEKIDAGQIGEVVARFETLATAMGMLGHLAIDADNEDFSIQQRNLGGLQPSVDVLSRALVAATGIPRAILLGEVNPGLGAGEATGEFRVWYDHIASLQTSYYSAKVRRLLTPIFRSQTGPTGGRVPEGYTIAWNELSQPNATERATIRTAESAARKTDIEAGVITEDEARQDPSLVEVYGIDPMEPAPGLPDQAQPLFGDEEDTEDDAPSMLGSEPASTIPPNEPLITLRQASERLGASPGAIKGMAKRGEIRSWRLRAGGPIMVQWSNIEDRIREINEA